MTTVGATEDKRSVEITCTKSQDSSVIITRDEWLVSIEDYKVDETKKKPRIEKVPLLLRNRESYKSCIDPFVVSIGPYHHGKSYFEAFEKLKTPIAQKFCRVNKKSIKDIYEEVAKVGKSARECYEEGSTKCYDDEVFNRMMFLDACFVLHFMSIGRELSFAEPNEADEQLERSYNLVLRDLVLLENQIPLLVLTVLMKSIFESPSEGKKIIKNFLQLYTLVSPMGNSSANSVNKILMRIMGFRSKSDQDQKSRESDLPTSSKSDQDQKSRESDLATSSKSDQDQKSRESDLATSSKSDQDQKSRESDLATSSKSDQDQKSRELLLATSSKSDQDQKSPEIDLYTSSKSDQDQKSWESDLDTSPHLLHLVRERLIHPVMHEFKNFGTWLRTLESKSNFRESYSSVTDLKSAGIFLKPSQTRSITDVEFKSRYIFGTLTLPPIKVDHSTKPLLLNLVAYEMCPHGPSDYRITSYICLMDSLIDDADDVKELRKKRILINKLGSDEMLAQFFNTIANDLVPEPLAYADAWLKIDNHCKYKGHIWIAEWIHKYFSSPWTLLALLGALSILGLTIAQTIFAAKQSS